MLRVLAIPDSAVSDCTDIRTKTEKIFQISRIAAIFQVPEIIVFHDPYLKPEQADRERRKITRILKYIECPQYLRKRLFPLSRDTAAVGILSPLAIPHHTKSRDLKHNEIREAAVFLNQGRAVADVGGTQLLTLASPPNQSLKNRTLRVTVQLNKTTEGFTATILKNPPKDKYWGYSVHKARGSLSKLLENRTEFKIATSRSCQHIKNVSLDILKNKNLLLAFGGPYKGLPEMVKAEGKKIQDIFDACFSVISNFGTRSIRLEEAMMITLSKLDSVMNNFSGTGTL